MVMFGLFVKTLPGLWYDSSWNHTALWLDSLVESSSIKIKIDGSRAMTNSDKRQ